MWQHSDIFTWGGLLCRGVFTNIQQSHEGNWGVIYPLTEMGRKCSSSLQYWQFLCVISHLSGLKYASVNKTILCNSQEDNMLKARKLIESYIINICNPFKVWYDAKKWSKNNCSNPTWWWRLNTCYSIVDVSENMSIW